MKKLGSLFVVLGLFGISTVSMAADSFEEMGVGQPDCSAVSSDIEKTTVAEVTTGDVGTSEDKEKEQIAVPVEE